MSESFPFRDDLNRQHMEFQPRAPGPEFVPKQAALAEAVGQEWRQRVPPPSVEAWFGDIWADHPLTSMRSRVRVPAHTLHPVWLVRIANVVIRHVGRGGGSRTDTELWVIVDGKTGMMLRRFSFR